MKGKPFARIIGVLKGVAPTAVAALAGPYAPLAAGVMRQVLGVDGDVEEAVLAAAADPATAVKLREIEAAMKAQEQQLGIRFAELEVEDRKDARLMARETSLAPQLVLAGLYTAAYITVLILFVTGHVNVQPEHDGMVNSLLGALGAVQIQVLNFFFGSSAGSARKTDVLAGSRT